ncbi:alpha/beta hydrolase [Frondihabitans cladoniiphilus]|uniref:alpha/beta hydrolase n=1 Tax=Frondihabitans cladoniiphilus TaxID=715785 RepID=UPI0031EE2801
MRTLAPVYTVAGIGLIAVTVLARRRLWWLLGGAVLGAAVGALLSWWVGDVLNLVDVSPSWVDRFWVSAVLAGFGVAIAAAIRGRWLVRLVAGISVIVFALAGGLAINRDAGFYPTVADAIGLSHVKPIALPAVTSGSTAFRPDLASSWQAPSDLPEKGRYGSIKIPGLVSKFAARRAIVYLPPAALIKNPPKLPVLIALSGQGPGAAPANVIEAGRLVSRLNTIAKANRGLTPIVVIPDQLSRPTNNPMCVNGRLGNSSTYLSVDVVNWIHKKLNAQTGRQALAISGFSQGGTCAIQLGAEFPQKFGSLIDVSGQLGPVLDSGQDTVKLGFAGDKAAYERAQPLNILDRNRPYKHSNAFFAVGQDDSRYGPDMPVVSQAAREAGMDVTTLIVPDSGHDWATAGIGLQAGITWIMPRVGLANPTPEA